MSPRRARMKKLAGVRERQLDEKVGVLNRSREAQEQAQRLVDEQERRLSAAEAQRQALQRDAVRAGDWIDANEWLEERRIHRQAAQVGAQRAEAAVRHATAEVLGARQALQQIRKLDEKLAASELETERRQERAAEDEFAARKVAEKGRK